MIFGLYFAMPIWIMVEVAPQVMKCKQIRKLELEHARYLHFWSGIPQVCAKYPTAGSTLCLCLGNL